MTEAAGDVDAAWREVVVPEIHALASRRGEEPPGFLSAMPYLLGVLAERKDTTNAARAKRLFGTWQTTHPDDPSEVTVDVADTFAGSADALVATIRTLNT